MPEQILAPSTSKAVYQGSAFGTLVAWVEHGVRRPADLTVGRTAGGDVVGSCALGGSTWGR
ncbi:hypothetical protein ACF09J_35045 [Streptomyces sp. NPDC014889]|uniref:hypothetical protein n=1 Tax=Streptomyces sp. NPDC014889 TaxID=3364928 RepID=UPI003701E7AB